MVGIKIAILDIRLYRRYEEGKEIGLKTCMAYDEADHGAMIKTVCPLRDLKVKRSGLPYLFCHRISIKTSSRKELDKLSEFYKILSSL